MRIHNQLPRGGLNDALKRGLGVTKDDGGVERFGETLSPEINPYGDELPEWRWLRNEHIKGQRITQALVAGENSIIALVNAAGRNRIVVVELVAVGAGGGAQRTGLDICTDAVLGAALAQANAAPTIGRDTRGPPGTVFTRQGSEVSTSLGVTVDQAASPATETQYFRNLPIVLSPGFGVAVIGFTIATAIEVIFGWRERAALPGELV